jgi:hypothetical protein
MQHARADVQTGKYVVRSELADVSNYIVHEQDSAEHMNMKSWMTYVDDIDQFQVAYPADRPPDKPIFMTGMSIERQPSGTPCSPSLTGTSQTEPLASANGKAEWGKVVLLNAYDAYIDAICRPSTAGCTQREIFEGSCKTTGGAYALCSEKDGKTVVICISQMTDNPKQAKEIFETFRWTR